MSIGPQIDKEHRPTEAVTLRALVLGVLLAGVADLYINWAVLILRASKLNKSYFPMGLFLPFVALAIVNASVVRRGGRGLTRAEMHIVLAMGLIGAFFPFFGLAGFVVGVIAAPYYFATPENGWADSLHPHVPDWMVLTDQDFAATWFYEGLPSGVSLPWASWAVPLGWWFVLVAASGWTIFCLMVMLRRQWVEHERLEYPLMTVGARLADPDSYLKAGGFRIGFCLGFFAVGWNVITYFYPVIPGLPTVPTAGTWLTWMPGAPTIWIQISIYILGMCYFARVEALFSFWFFFLLTGIEVAVFDRIGVSVGAGGLEAVRSQSFGALCTLAVASLYAARVHLADVFRKAFRGDASVPDFGGGTVLPSGGPGMRGRSCADVRVVECGGYGGTPYRALPALGSVGLPGSVSGGGRGWASLREHLRHGTQLDTPLPGGCTLGSGIQSAFPWLSLRALCHNSGFSRASDGSNVEARERVDISTLATVACHRPGHRGRVQRIGPAHDLPGKPARRV